MRGSLDTFDFRLEYKGPDPEKHKSLYLSVQAAPEILPESWLRARVSGEQAAALIGYLAGDGLLYRGTVNREKLLAQPKGPYYTLTVSDGKGDEYFEFIPLSAKPFRWHGFERPPALQQFQSLRAVLAGDAGKAMDSLFLAIESKLTRPPTPGEGLKKDRPAFHDPVDPKAREQFVQWTRAAMTSLLRDLDTFSFRLERRGPDAEKHRSLYLSVEPVPETLPGSYLKARLSKDQADRASWDTWSCPPGSRAKLRERLPIFGAVTRGGIFGRDGC